MQNGSYETEIDLLRLKNAELEARVNELESDMERILVRVIYLGTISRVELGVSEHRNG